MTDLEFQLASMSSFDAVKFILSGVELHPIQCIDVMKALASKRAIVSYTTGLGKTVVAAAMMRLLLNEDPNRKFIFFGIHDQLAQTPAKLENMCGRKVAVSSADAKDLGKLLADDWTAYSILFLTHDVLANDKFMNELFKNRQAYTGIFIDEAHNLSNVGNAQKASVMSGVARQFEYCIALTATPIVTSVIQLARLAFVVDPVRFPKVAVLKKMLEDHQFNIEDEPCFFINRTRDDFNSKTFYRGYVKFVEPMPHQRMDCGGLKLFQLCKGDGAYPQAETLVRLVKEFVGKQGLIYINQHMVREWVLPFLKESGIRFECINGFTPLEERRRIMEDFNVKHMLDVVITSVTTALDLDCDYVIFYEFTVEVKQMIGRAHRGLGDKVLDIVWIITDDTNEVDYFVNNVYKPSELIHDILRQDITEVRQAYEEVSDVKV